MLNQKCQIQLSQGARSYFQTSFSQFGGFHFTSYVSDPISVTRLLALKAKGKCHLASGQQFSMARALEADRLGFKSRQQL